MTIMLHSIFQRFRRFCKLIQAKQNTAHLAMISQENIILFDIHQLDAVQSVLSLGRITLIHQDFRLKNGKCGHVRVGRVWLDCILRRFQLATPAKIISQGQGRNGIIRFSFDK